MKAFPHTFEELVAIKEDRVQKGTVIHEGMDLRDYFAAKAMQGMLAHTGVVYGKNASVDDSAGAIRAYAIADKMMKARNETA
jgi:hypothetical protein